MINSGAALKASEFFIIVIFDIMKTLLFLLFVTTAFAQHSVIVGDDSNKQPIPYVNIWWNDGGSGGTCDINGKYSFDGSIGQKMTLSAVGYETRSIELSRTTDTIFLKQQVLALKEVPIRRIQHKIIKLGSLKSSNINYAVIPDYAVRIFAKKFKLPTTEANAFLKKLSVKTQANLPQTILNVRFYSVNESGEPGDLLYHENVLMEIKKGNHTSTIDLNDRQIEFPPTGIFIALENLLLEQNRFEISYQMESSDTLKTVSIYEPRIKMLENRNEKDTWSFDGEKWKVNEKHSISMELVVGF